MEILPDECLCQIFGNFHKIPDIVSASRLCNRFHLLVKKSISIIDDNEPYYKIVYDLKSIWPNLHTVHLKNSLFLTTESAKIVSLKTLTITLSKDHLSGIWVLYWLERTQKEFESISHIIHYSSVYEGQESFEFQKGIMINRSEHKRLTSYTIGILSSLTYKFLIKFQFDLVGLNSNDIGALTRDLKLSNIGIKITNISTKFNPFHFIYWYPNIRYIEIDPLVVFDNISSYDMLRHLQAIPNTCDREVEINIPIYPNCESLFRRLFPKNRCIKIIKQQIRVV